MNQLGSFLLLIGVAAVALAALGAVVGWYNEEGRCVRRGLRKVLKGETHALIIAHGRGRGAGLNFTSNTMAVAWDSGAWCLVYRIEELRGVELIVDNQVAGRAFRGETRRPVDALGAAEKQVSLRLVFDDPQHADFMLDLWSAARAPRRPVLDAAQAVEEGNRWLARLESVFRRQPVATRSPPRPEPPRSAVPSPAPSKPAAAERPFVLEAEEPDAGAAAATPQRPVPAPPPRSAATEGRQELPFDDEAPWDEDEDEDDQQALL